MFIDSVLREMEQSIGKVCILQTLQWLIALLIAENEYILGLVVNVLWRCVEDKMGVNANKINGLKGRVSLITM